MYFFNFIYHYYLFKFNRTSKFSSDLLKYVRFYMLIPGHMIAVPTLLTNSV